jgi:hypothetical protein
MVSISTHDLHDMRRTTGNPQNALCTLEPANLKTCHHPQTFGISLIAFPQ